MRKLPEIAIRLASSLDYDQLTRFFERNDIETITRYFHPFPLSAESAAMICLREHRDVYCLASAADEIVGFYMLRGWEEGFSIPSFGVFVDHAWHARGLGRFLTEAALDTARARGSESVRLTVHAANAAAMKLYQSLGFTETSRQEHGAPGAGDAVVVMHRRLSKPQSGRTPFE